MWKQLTIKMVRLIFFNRKQNFRCFHLSHEVERIFKGEIGLLGEGGGGSFYDFIAYYLKQLNCTKFKHNE